MTAPLRESIVLAAALVGLVACKSNQRLKGGITPLDTQPSSAQSNSIAPPVKSHLALSAGIVQNRRPSDSEIRGIILTEWFKRGSWNPILACYLEPTEFGLPEVDQLRKGARVLQKGEFSEGDSGVFLRIAPIRIENAAASVIVETLLAIQGASTLSAVIYQYEFRQDDAGAWKLIDVKALAAS